MNSTTVEKWKLLLMQERGEEMQIILEQMRVKKGLFWFIQVSCKRRFGTGVFVGSRREIRLWRSLDSLINFMRRTFPNITEYEIVISSSSNEF